MSFATIVAPNKPVDSIEKLPLNFKQELTHTYLGVYYYGFGKFFICKQLRIW